MSKLQRTYLAPGIRVRVGNRPGSVLRTVKHRNLFYRQRVAVLLDGDTKETQEYIDEVTLTAERNPNAE